MKAHKPRAVVGFYSPLPLGVDGTLLYLNLNVFGSAPNQSCYQPSAGGLLELVLRHNLSILAPGNLGTPPKARDELAENSRNFAFYESALLRKLYTGVSGTTGVGQGQ
jgi:hypothetical protein